MLYVDEFDDPKTGWERTKKDGWRKDYENGIYFLEAPVSWAGTHATACTDHLPQEFQVTVTARVLGVGGSRGGWGLLIVGPDAGRGLAVTIDRVGAVLVDPSFWGLKKYPNDTHYGEVRHPAVLNGDQWNKLSIRVRRRQMELLVNDKPIGDPIKLDWDLTPAAAQLSLMKPDFGARVRVEFQKVEIRELR